ncbi:MAG: hypothetical protein CMO82_10110 [Winogradskyella sp.]|uniref:T9SS type A sorting domain-containing protein n=1 Tax=Winogradskyella poriferorum TaxID=307627 RepID=A0ABU7W8T5_9FLAO|nr:hypothetical protein [Winogradskyella sp.]|tara:strand:+ start:622 stop:1923 length:1302 start_codon:yes stop_codon:yes gene_type:complete
MKKITLLFLTLFATTSLIYGQCTTTTGGQWPNGVVTVLNTGGAETISTNNWPNAEISLLEGLVVGNTYTITGTNTTSVYITVAETTSTFSAIGTVITHGADSVSFTATTPEILVFWHLNAACGTQNNDNTLTTIQCTSASCTCTAGATPDLATTPIPADTAVDVDITYGETNSIAFEWTDAGTGDAPDAYNLNLGVTPAGNDIGSLTNVSSGVNVLYGFQPNTTYYWSVDPVNCVGSSTGTVWSFTTTACTATAAPAVVGGPSPADGASAVTIYGPDGLVNFSWAAGAPEDNYVLNIGTANPPDQSFDFEIGDPLTGLQVNTTYFWSIDAVNCFGVTEGPVWSFTTDSSLSITDEQLVPFSIYPNPANDKLNIKTTLEIDNVTIFNILGQEVANYDGSEIIESSINISEYKSGLYLVQITSGDKTEIIKVTKN